MRTMVEVDAVVKRYGSLEALRGISLRVEEGEFFGLLGPNGAGKSTLLYLLSGYHDGDAGTVRLAGLPVGTAHCASRSHLGLAPQSLALYEDLTAEANLRYFGKLYGLSDDLLRRRSAELLAMTGLTERRKDRVKSFSGGMKRRLNLAVALLHRPRVLLCDEPTVGVDPQSRHAIFEFLQDRQREEKLTVIYTTHYMEEAERLCTRLAIIDHGRIIAEGSREALLQQAAGQPVLEFPAWPAYLDQAGWEPLGVLAVRQDRASLSLHPGVSWSGVYQHIESRHWPVGQFRPRTASLESLFLQLTGQSLRDS